MQHRLIPLAAFSGTVLAFTRMSPTAPNDRKTILFALQSNFNGSNTDGSFTMANSNSVLSPYRIFPLTQENKYCWKFSYFIMRLYVVCTHYNRLIKAILMSTHNILLFVEDRKHFHKLSPFAS